MEEASLHALSILRQLFVENSKVRVTEASHQKLLGKWNFLTRFLFSFNSAHCIYKSMFEHLWDVYWWQSHWSNMGLPIQDRGGEEAPIISTPLLLVWNWPDTHQLPGTCPLSTSPCRRGPKWCLREKEDQQGFRAAVKPERKGAWELCKRGSQAVRERDRCKPGETEL